MTERTQTADPAARRRGLTAFRWGVIVGVLAPLAAVAALGGLGRRLAPQPAYNVEIVSTGADVTRHNGVKLIVSSEKAAMAQSCNGVCDDLHVEASSGDDAYKVSVLDPQGQCIACGAPEYVTNGYGAPVSKWTVSGASKLEVSVSIAPRPASTR